MALSNSYYIVRLMRSTKPEDREAMSKVGVIWPNQSGAGTHVNVSGAGLTAHTRHRAAATRFLEYLSSVEAQQMFANVSMEYPVNPKAETHPIVRAWGTFRQDDINIAAAGELQADATRLSDRVGYK